MATAAVVVVVVVAVVVEIRGRWGVSCARG